MTIGLNIDEDDDLIHINEVNSGYQDHRDFKRVLGELMNLIKIKLEYIKNANGPIHFIIKYLLKTVKYKASIHQYNSVISQKLTIVFMGEVKSATQKSEIFTSSGTYFSDNGFTIKIGVDKNRTTLDVLTNIDKVEYILTHELVHIFQNLYGNYKKTQAYYKKAADKSGDTFGDWYWTNKFEIEAYTAQINTQLRQIKTDNPDIKFKSAMLRIEAWRNLNEFIPENYKHILKRILHKTVHYWTHNLGGKINEFTIKL